LAGQFQGIGDVLAQLRSRGYLVGVVSSKTRELGKRGLRLCLLDEWIDATVFLEDTSRHKPAPDPILKALDSLNASAVSSAYVGDSPHDLVAGRAAGVRTVAAMWGPGCREDIERENPDFVVHSASELLDIFT
jgi:pyrophosphatase PpaX